MVDILLNAQPTGTGQPELEWQALETVTAKLDQHFRSQLFMVYHFMNTYSSINEGVYHA